MARGSKECIVSRGGAFGEHAFLPEITLVDKRFLLVVCTGFTILRAVLQPDCPLPDDVWLRMHLYMNIDRNIYILPAPRGGSTRVLFHQVEDVVVY